MSRLSKKTAVKVGLAFIQIRSVILLNEKLIDAVADVQQLTQVNPAIVYCD